MPEERIGRVSVSVEPDFDQAELFRQLRAATKKLPAITLKPKILAKDVNAAIREVNKKKLVKLNIGVNITVASANAAIREVNRKKLIPLTPPVRLTVREVNKAIREVNRKKLIPIDATIRIKELTKTTRNVDKFNKSVKGARTSLRSFAANITIVRSAFSLVRVSAIATAIGFLTQALASAVTAATALSAAISPGLLGGLAATAVGATAAGQALGVLSLAVSGVDKALKGLNEEIDQKKLLALTPAARSFVIELDKLKPAIRGLQQSLQEELFSRLVDSISILTPLMNQLAGPMQQTARVMGDLAVNAAKVVAIMSDDLERTMTTNNILIRNFGNAAIDLSRALVDVLVAAGPLAVFLSNSTRSLAVVIRRFIAAKRESGELAEFFELAANTLIRLGRIARGTATTIVNIFREAIPFGSVLLEQLADASDRLAEITGSVSGRQSIREFFTHSLPAVQEMGRLIRDLGKAFIELSQQPGFLLLIQALRTQLLPVLTDVIAKLTAEFGPVLVSTLTSMALLFAQLAGAAGPLNALVKVIGELAFFLQAVAKEHPNILAVASAFFLLESALAIGGIQVFLFRASGLSVVLKTLANVIRFDLFPAFKAFKTGSVATAGSALLRVAGIIGIIIAALRALVIFIPQFAQNMRNGFSVVESAARAFSFAVLTVVKEVLEGFKLLTDAIANLPNIPGIGGGIVASAKISSKALGELIGQIDGLNEVTEAVKPPKMLGPEVPAALQAQLDFKKALGDSQKSIEESFAASRKEFKDLTKVAVPSMDSIKDAIEPAASAADVMKERLQGTVDTMRDRLSLLGDVLERQRSLVDGLKNSIEELRNVQISGTKAFDDARFALDQQTKSLELQQVELKLAGVASEDPRFEALTQQIDSLRLQAEKVDLTESLQLDPARRKFEELTNPIKELNLDTAVAEFQRLTKEHDFQSVKLENLQTRYDKVNDAIQKTERTISRISRSTENLTSGISAAVSAPSVIAKPLEKANEALGASKVKITQNINGVREGLRKPFRLAARDINGILKALPNVANEGAQVALAWTYSVGAAMGRRLIRGMMDGMRSFLVEGSSLHKLLNEEIPDFIRQNKGPISADRQILVPAGVAIMEGLTTGLQRGFDPVKGYLAQVGPSMEEFVPDSLFAKRTAEFMVDVAAGKKPDPKKFFGDLAPDPISITGGVVDPRLGFLHKTQSLADTAGMAASLAKTFGVVVTSLLRPGAITSSGNLSDHGFGLAADLSNGNQPTPQMDALAAALKPLYGTIVKQLIYRDKDQNKGYPIPGHMNHVHVAFLPGAGFSLHSGRIGKAAAGKSPFAAIFAAASQAFGIPARILQAVAKAESGFNPRAGSFAGAKGIMQLLPSTFAAQHVGSNIFDPKQNIFAGAKYLSAQLKRFKSLRLALAAYNAGPGAVNSFGGIPPFAETLAYIARVLKFLADFGGFRAMGGPTRSGKSYIVGERGPELRFERKDGFVMSNKDVGNMVSLLKDIRDTGGLRSTNIQTASQDPRVVMELLEAQNRRRRARIDL